MLSLGLGLTRVGKKGAGGAPGATSALTVTMPESSSFHLLRTGSVGFGTVMTFAFWTAGVVFGTNVVFFQGKSAGGTIVHKVGIFEDGKLRAEFFNTAGGPCRRQQIDNANVTGTHFWVVRFRYPGTTVAAGDIEIYRDGTLLTPAGNDNFGNADGEARDFEVFPTPPFSGGIAAVSQMSLTAGWQDPANFGTGAVPKNFSGFSPTPLIALGDTMSVAQWAAGTNLGSGGALTPTGTSDLAAGTPSSVTLG